MVGYGRHVIYVSEGRGFPTDFPVVGFDLFIGPHVAGRGFPTDFPVVGWQALRGGVLAPYQERQDA